MKKKKARVAILWHMHQPYYRNQLTGQSSLPWVRLHAVKDYYSMASLLRDYPEVHVTFNFVPSLIKQILEYAEEGLRDDFWDKSVISPSDLSAAERIFILRNFFMVNWDLIIKRYPRYCELLEKRGYRPSISDLERAVTLFSSQDFLDLQVWFNLAWFHPMDIKGDKSLADIHRRGRNFNDWDKKYVLEKQLEIIEKVIPLYRELMHDGQVELSTSPFYHPILPLLVNVESAREALPDVELPSPPFRRPDDASMQLKKAVDYHQKIFGRKPDGLWPSEGSVSEEMIPQVMDSGFSWMASDEDILYRSWGMDPSSRPMNEEQRCRTLYKPYRLDRDGRTLSVIFRDHYFSDSIGFSYGHWEPRAAAADFIGRLECMTAKCLEWNREPLISIILDGENPWEYYQEQGYSFLKDLYGRLKKSKILQAVTVSEALKEDPAEDNIPRLFAGSWINHNFQIWIGHHEDRRAWELLAKARGVLDGLCAVSEDSSDNYEKALEEILIAEGSDWCWWYGDENSSGNDEAFDELYRLHLKNVYALAGKEVPDEFKVTIFTGKRLMVPIIKIYSFIKPVIDGRVSSYFEWLAAGEYPIDYHGAMMMHRADRILSAIYFGFDLDNLYIRVDPAMKILANDLQKYSFNLHFLRPHKIRFVINPVTGQAPNINTLKLEGADEPHAAESVTAAIMDVMEVAVPFKTLQAGTGDQIDFFVSLSREGMDMGHWPNQGYLSVKVPSEDFEQKMWSI